MVRTPPPQGPSHPPTPSLPIQAPDPGDAPLPVEPIHTIRLKPGEQDRLLAGHPWIFQNELEGWPPDAAPGDLVDLHDSQGHFLGRGYLNPRTTLAVRVLARDRVPVDQEFFLARIRQAMALRERVMPARTVYRVVHGEA